eukprot:2776446-Karenia_brevis.AAC.1
MVLRGSCADVSKVMYQLRLNGDLLDESDLAVLGTIQRTGVAHTLGGDVGDLAWMQATRGRQSGGLGLRPASEVALPAFVASRTASRCGAGQLFRRLEEAGFAAEGELMRAYDRRTADARRRLEAMHSDGTGL